MILNQCARGDFSPVNGGNRPESADSPGRPPRALWSTLGSHLSEAQAGKVLVFLAYRRRSVLLRTREVLMRALTVELVVWDSPNLCSHVSQAYTHRLVANGHYTTFKNIPR